jgi:ATP-dependent RNA helicase DeaD
LTSCGVGTVAIAIFCLVIHSMLRTVVESLSGEFDPMDVAAAAVKMVHESLAGSAAQEDDIHIPAYESFARPDRPPARPYYETPQGGQPHFEQRGAREQRGPGFRDGPRDGPRGETRGETRGGMRDARDMVRVYIGAGRNLGMRPADIVGAIANEARVNPRGIGDIEIGDRFTLVELPAQDAGRVVESLRGATMRGRKVSVRLDDGRRNKR